MRTICYVDGYNLYYGCLKNTTFKWLDLDLLLCRLLNEQFPQSELHLVKYFTADIKANFSRHGHINRFDRPGNERLSQHADWTRRHIREEELAQAQLPRVVSTKRKPIFKPDHW